MPEFQSNILTNHQAVVPVAAEGPAVEYRGLTLRTAFQPIVSVVNGRAVGYEALLRATTRGGQPVAPPVVFEEAEGVGELTLVNQMVSDLHVRSFRAHDPGDCWLFLNVSTSVFASLIKQGGNLFELTARHGIAPERIVIEVLEHEIADDDSFGGCLTQYRDAGFMVALDDFGKGLSNLDRIFNFVPSIVKFDMGLVAQARGNPKIQRAYRHLTAMLHEVGTLVLAEGIETVSDALFMVDAGVDFLQGYWLARPASTISSGQIEERIHELRAAYAVQAHALDREERDTRELLAAAIAQAAAQFVTTGEIESAGALFNAMPGAMRFFVLDQHGIAIGSVVSHRWEHNARRSQFAPLLRGGLSSFMHRRYFRDAIWRPGEVQFVSPFYSFLDATSADIAAIAVTRGGEIFVVCGIYIKPR